MTESDNHDLGRVVWTDLSVPNADEVQDFYRQVVGWETTIIHHGDHCDYNMVMPEADEAAARIIHAELNEDLPPQWLIYITVADLEASMETCKRLGGKVIAGPRPIDADRFCVVQDPAGAVVALYQP